MGTKIPVIIDTDPGIDDVIAILFALASPELEILAFITSFGNTDIHSSHLNILKLYQALEKHFERYPEERIRYPNYGGTSKPFLACGAHGPMEGDLHSARKFHGRDGLGNISERHPDLNLPAHNDFTQKSHSHLQITEQAVASLVADLIKSRPARSVTYLTLGPLTNLAQVMLSEGELIRDRIGRVVCMGGALDVPGNKSPTAEFNFFADPYAVQQLLCPSSVRPSWSLPLDRLLLLPLDVTTPHELRFAQYKARIDAEFESTIRPSRSSDKTPLVHFTSAFLERTREVMLAFGKDALELHDIVAVWCAMENPSHRIETQSLKLSQGWKASKRKFQIERVGEFTRGMLVVDRRSDQGAYAPGANRAEVQAELDRLHGRHQGEWESTAVPAPDGGELQSTAWTDKEDGVWCVKETPGPDVLTKELLHRIWGVQA